MAAVPTRPGLFMGAPRESRSGPSAADAAISRAARCAPRGRIASDNRRSMPHQSVAERVLDGAGSARLRRDGEVRRTARACFVATLARVLAVAALAASDDRARTADALLDLLAVDADAAAPQADPAQEQRERAAAGDRIFEALDGLLPQAQLDVARELRGLARADGPSERTAALARTLQRVLERRYGEALPERAPDLARGAALYAQSCSACHGASGSPPPRERLGTVHGADRPFQSAGNAPVQPEARLPRGGQRSAGDGHAFLCRRAQRRGAVGPGLLHRHAFPPRRRKPGCAGAGERRRVLGGRAPGFPASPTISCGLQFQAAGLNRPDAEQALAAARAGPFAAAGERLPRLILPQSLASLAWVWQQTEDETGTPVERAAGWGAQPPAEARRARESACGGAPARSADAVAARPAALRSQPRRL